MLHHRRRRRAPPLLHVRCDDPLLRTARAYGPGDVSVLVILLFIPGEYAGLVSIAGELVRRVLRPAAMSRT